MCLDPVCAFLSLLWVIGSLRKFHDRTKEWPGYQQSLKNASDTLAKLDSDRNHLSSSKLCTVGWEGEDRDIAAARLALETARKLVDWSDEACIRTGLNTGSGEFAIKYKEATENQKFLKQCMDGLQEILQKTNQLTTNLEKRAKYLQETRGKTSTALAEEYMKHVITYTGVRKQTPHPALSAPHPAKQARS
jgi:hypothetical protein